LVDAVEKVFERCIFMGLSRRQFKVDRNTSGITYQMDFCGKTAAGAA
jgi:hypothetical protein